MSQQNTSWKNYVASVSAGVISISTFNSLDTVRVRWQVIDRAAFGSLREYTQYILRTEGFLRGLQFPAMFSNSLAVGCSTGLRLGMYPYVRELASGKQHGKDVPAFIMFGTGLACGMLSYFIATPLWSIKTRQQSEKALSPTRSTVSTFAYLVQDFNEMGFLNMWRGAGPLIVRGGLISAGQIGGYDFAKSRAKSYNLMQEGTALHILSSFASALVASTIALPVDVLFSRYVTNKKLSMRECVVQLYHEKAFFRGWTALLTRLTPTFALAMPIYEQVRFFLGLGFL